MNRSTPGLPVHHQLPESTKPMSIESVMPPNHLILCHPLLLLPSIFPNIRVFSNESALCIRWPKYWSFSFNISPFSEHQGLIPFSMDWLDLLAVQRILKSLLQHHTSQLRPTLCNPMDHTVHGILQTRMLEWVSFPFSRRCSQPRDRTQVSLIAGAFFERGQLIA